MILRSGLFTITVMLLLTGIGCSSLVKTEKENHSEAARLLQAKEIEPAERALQNEDWGKALQLFSEFTTHHPISVYLLQANYGMARAKEGLGHCDEALPIYRRIGEEGREKASEFAALSYLRMVSCFEPLGDESRVAAAIADAERLAASLPDEARNLELPAKKAASLARRGLNDEARIILRKVERSLPQMSAESPLEARTRHAKLLLQIGVIESAGLSADQYLARVDVLQSLQPFLWKSALLKVPGISDQAQGILLKNYQALGSFIQSAPEFNSGRNQRSAQRMKLELQRKWAGRLSESIESLRLLSDRDFAEAGEGFVQGMSEVEDVTRQVLWGRQSETPLTEESKALNAPMKPGRVISHPVFDTEKNPEKKMESQKNNETLPQFMKDPNLIEGH